MLVWFGEYSLLLVVPCHALVLLCCNFIFVLLMRKVWLHCIVYSVTIQCSVVYSASLAEGHV